MSSKERKDSELTEDLKRLLAIVLDEIIPPSDDGRLPGAGQAGVAAYIEQTLQRMPDLHPLIVQGLAELGDAARRQHGRDFSELSRQERLKILNEQGFAIPLTLHVYAGYYQNPAVLEALGLPLRAPHPEGYEMEPNDFKLLEPVRQRPPFYRKC